MTACARWLQGTFALVLLTVAGLMSGQDGKSAERRFRFHSIRRLPPGSQTRTSAFYPKQASTTSSRLIDWRFLDRTAVHVSDGVHDAEIRYPAEIRELDGQSVSITGQMNPWQSDTDFSQFVLTPARSPCITCNPPAVTLIIHVSQKRTPKDHPAPFAAQVIRVTGILRLFSFESWHPAHQADFLYALDDAVVEIASSHLPTTSALPTPAVFRRQKPSP